MKKTDMSQSEMWAKRAPNLLKAIEAAVQAAKEEGIDFCAFWFMPSSGMVMKTTYGNEELIDRLIRMVVDDDYRSRWLRGRRRR